MVLPTPVNSAPNVDMLLPHAAAMRSAHCSVVNVSVRQSLVRYFMTKTSKSNPFVGPVGAR
jgi:hypothetical protein